MKDKVQKVLNLTKDREYIVKVDRGQGILSIGPLSTDNKKGFDVLVDERLPINWDCFNDCYTGYGEQHIDKYPNGDWPRFFAYYGNDKGFINWSGKRHIEDFHWYPLKPIHADFTKSDIGGLIINIEEHKVAVKLDSSISRIFSIVGNLDNISIENDKELYLPINFRPHTTKDIKKPYQLPNFDSLKASSNISVSVDPLGQPLDCKSLLQFDFIKHLSLSGNLINLDELTELRSLSTLSLRYVPNLDLMPSLSSWDKLTSFIGGNIEINQGKRLRTELIQLKKQREMDYSSVSQLRKAVWFMTEYGIPFSAWSGKNARVATKAYKEALKLLKKAKDESEVQKTIENFAHTFNSLDNMETTEREDIMEAVLQLIQVSDVIVCEEKAQQWFDAVRDY